MTSSVLLHYGLLFFAALAGGAINSLAGGGTLLTFPALLSVGILPTAANATSTVALLPGSISSWQAYRHELRKDGRLLPWLGVPSVIGGVIGARLVLFAGDKNFALLVPWLILGATLLFIVQEPITRWLRSRSEHADGKDELNIKGGAGLIGAFFFQLLVAIYGGFFGAGIGILMLAALGLLGFSDIHRMNGLKNFAASCINGVAALTFILSGRVHWNIALFMAVGAILGGYGAARFAKRIGRIYVRRTVVVIGLAIAVSLFWRQISHQPI